MSLAEPGGCTGQVSQQQDTKCKHVTLRAAQVVNAPQRTSVSIRRPPRMSMQPERKLSLKACKVLCSLSSCPRVLPLRSNLEAPLDPKSTCELRPYLLHWVSFLWLQSLRPNLKCGNQQTSGWQMHITPPPILHPPLSPTKEHLATSRLWGSKYMNHTHLGVPTWGPKVYINTCIGPTWVIPSPQGELPMQVRNLDALRLCSRRKRLNHAGKGCCGISLRGPKDHVCY